QRMSLGEISARSFLLRTGLQLAALYPEAFALGETRLEISQRVGEVRAGGDVIGADVQKVRASPFHQTVLRIMQEVHQTSGRITGLRVREWITDTHLLDIDDLAQIAFINPLRS